MKTKNNNKRRDNNNNKSNNRDNNDQIMNNNNDRTYYFRNTMSCQTSELIYFSILMPLKMYQRSICNQSRKSYSINDNSFSNFIS